MDIAKIRKLIKLVQASDITEIEVEEGNQRVRISRGMTVTPVVAAPVLPAPVATVANAAESMVVAEESPVDEASLLTSPMVGTFYRASSPDIDPFVREGARVQKGDTLCIIEAMKLMNAIEAEYDGVVRAILVENASPVEYGQPMFEITPA